MSDRRDGKKLDWHLGDIEQRFGFTGGKYTDVNMLMATIASAMLSCAFYISLCHAPRALRGTKCLQMLLERGWTPYAMVALATLALCILFVKWRKLAFQKRAFKLELVPAGAEFALTSETVVDVLARLDSLVDEPKRFALFNRIERALLNLKNVGNVSDVSEMLRAQAENDESHADSGWGVLSGIVWAIPILGFIGTVAGLSGSIGGFGSILGDNASIDTLRTALTPVTANLSVAFDTTFVALILALSVQSLATILRKREDSFFDECRDYAHANIISRLKVSQQR